MNRTVKKWFVLLLSVSLVLGVLPIAASAADSGSCGSGVYWALQDNGTLAITGSGEMTNYSNSTYAPWDDQGSRITKVTVAGGVTRIGNYAFYGLDNLSSVELSEGLATIGSYAFYWCGALTTLEIPATVDNIVTQAFSRSGLQKVTFKGAHLSAIGNNVFGGSGLKGVKIFIPTGFTVGSTAAVAGKPDSGLFAGNYVSFLNGTASVFWENESGALLETDLNVAAGAVPSFDGTIPQKAEDEQYTYTFSAWTPAPAAVSGNEIYVYRPTYTQTEKQVHEHSYGAPTWSWTENNTAVASFVCTGSGCGYTETVTDASPALTEVTPADCENNQTAKYVARVLFHGVEYSGETDAFTVENTKLNHNYQFDSFVWAEDGRSAQVKLICTNDPSHVTYEAAVMSEATTPAACEADAFTVYTATYGEHTDDNTVTEANTRLNHNYQFDSFVWSKSGNTAQAKLVCANNPAHVTYEAAEMSEAKHDATCETDAYIVYTAAYDGHSEENTVTIPDSAGHAYGEPTWQWEDETLARATFVCASGDSRIDVSAKAEDGQITREVITEATADAEGLARYTATVVWEGRTYTDTFDKVIPVGEPQDQPDEPDDPDGPDDPGEPSGENPCKWCGEVHTGFWGKLVGFFHSILYFFAHLFGRR